MEKETLLKGFEQRVGVPDAQTGMCGDTGISGKTLDAFVESILPTITDDSSVDDAFYERHAGFLKAMGGQMRHEKAEFVKQHTSALHDGGNGGNGGNGGAGGSENRLMEKIKALEERLDASECTSRQKSLRGSVSAAGKTLKVTNEALWRDVAMSVPCNDDMDEEAFTKSVKSEYEKKLKSYMGEGQVPYHTSGGNGQGGNDKAYENAKEKREAFFNRMAKRHSPSAKANEK